MDNDAWKIIWTSSVFVFWVCVGLGLISFLFYIPELFK